MNLQVAILTPLRSLTLLALLPSIDLLRMYLCILISDSLMFLISEAKCFMELWSKIA